MAQKSAMVKKKKLPINKCIIFSRFSFLMFIIYVIFFLKQVLYSGFLTCTVDTDDLVL